MALKDKSLFTWGIQVHSLNCYLPFKNSSGGAEIDAVLNLGFYTLTTLATEIARAMNAADSTNTYGCTVDRTYSNNTQNRLTISTSGSYLKILFGTSSFAWQSITNLVPFGNSDLTGATSYTSTGTTGTSFQTSWYGKNYQPPTLNLKVIGVKNMAADGTVETVWWSQQQLIQVEFQYEAQAYALATWQPFLSWIVRGRPVDFTPETNVPATVYSVTLDKSNADGKGLGIQMKEMIPDYPLLYTTGPLDFRLVSGSYNELGS